MSTSKKPAPRRTLTSRLRSARFLLRQWRLSLVDSDKCRVPGPNYGKVTSPAALHELARFDAALAALTEAIKVAKERT